MMSIPELLDKLDDLQLQLDGIQKEQVALIESVMPKVPQEILDKVEEIREEFLPKLEKISEDMRLLEEQIKSGVVEVGESVRSKNGTLLAVYVKGRTSWDSNKLDGVAMVIPQVAECKKIGSPSVTIRRS
jgi:phage host-nuclease inhibitor protein Gam